MRTSQLSAVRSPADLKALPAATLDDLAAEIRAELVSAVTKGGGHLGPNLGVVELTIAVHRVFDSPQDPIVFDTGHQSYVHKMLTGRAGSFAWLRQAGGLSGYPNRTESEHDIVENSHASTALSYADGLAKAVAVSAERGRCVVAVVGDGALTGGMCWEALNNIGARPDRQIVIVLNDNGRSYAPTVGGLARHLADLRGGRCEPSLFTALGLRYVGPVAGHDIAAMEAALREARGYRAPTIVHCVTSKGHGYQPAESEPADRMHTIGPARVKPEGAVVDQRVCPGTARTRNRATRRRRGDRGDAPAHGTAPACGPLPRTGPRRGDRRAARRHVGGRTGHRWVASGGRGLLDLHEPRL